MIITHDFPLSEVLWYKVGGKAKYFITAENREDILRALDFIEKNHPNRLFICGLGSNLIFTDDYFDGAVIQIAKRGKGEEMKGRKSEIEIDKNGLVHAFSGIILDDLIKYSINHGFSGLEWAGGLPGTVGAGIRGNAGAFGGEIKDVFFNAELLELQDKGFDILHLGSDKFNFSYRNSIVKENTKLLVLSAKFKLHHANENEAQKAREIYENNIQYRKDHHPLEFPTCGSVFKNISNPKQIEKVISVWPDIKELVETKWHGKVSMGYINKRLGFSGYRIGSMEVSPKHCNFITNLGGAQASDVLTIITHIQERIGETFGFTPEVEVEIVR